MRERTKPMSFGRWRVRLCGDCAFRCLCSKVCERCCYCFAQPDGSRTIPPPETPESDPKGVWWDNDVIGGRS